MSTSIQIKQTTLDLAEGDITQQTLDAVVNAANSGLAGGGGVDGAIHNAAGRRELQDACRQIGRCPTGEAVITPGFNLSSKYIIHAVGPIYKRGSADSPRLLASAYRRSLEVAVENGIKTLAFPAISTGVYGYPMEEAAAIALQTAKTFAEENESLELIRFVLFGAQAFGVFKDALGKLS